ncbi:hypothetical protein DITRI_Ditri15bG0030900 [Diplodiscus trichospermus]
MTNSSSRATMLVNLILLLSLLIIFNMAESRFYGVGHAKAKKLTPTCLSIYGTEEGDTCFSITQAFNLTSDFFNQINPNLNCDQIFVGQWLCVDGFLS